MPHAFERTGGRLPSGPLEGIFPWPRERRKRWNLAEWERNWVEGRQRRLPPGFRIGRRCFCQEMLALSSKDISSESLLLNRKDMVGTWSLAVGGQEELCFNIPARMLSGLKGITLERLKGDGELSCNGYVLEADGEVVASSSAAITSENGKLHYEISVPAGIRANNGCALTLKLKSQGAAVAGICLAD